MTARIRSQWFALARPTLVVVAAFGLLWLAIGVLQRVRSEPRPAEDERAIADRLRRRGVADLKLPTPELGPAEVVAMQLAGLADQRPDGVGVLQCYLFASPDNRSVTGPLERFAQLVRSPPYDAMAAPRRVHIGVPLGDDRTARVLVTLVSGEAGVQAFAFLLRRQPGGPFRDCWMTEGVLPAPVGVEPPATRPPPRRFDEA